MPGQVRGRGSSSKARSSLPASPYSYPIVPPPPLTENPMLNVLFGVRYPMQDALGLVRCVHCQRTLLRQAYSQHQSRCEVLQQQRIEEQQLRQIPALTPNPLAGIQRNNLSPQQAAYPGQPLQPFPHTGVLTPAAGNPPPVPPVSRKRPSSSIHASSTATPNNGSAAAAAGGAGTTKTAGRKTSAARQRNGKTSSTGSSRTAGGKSGPPAKRRRTTRKDKPLNLDDMCGVLIPETQEQCRRCLTCKQHSVKAKRIVTGRSRPFSELVELRRKRIALMKQQKAKQQQEQQQQQSGKSRKTKNAPASSASTASSSSSSSAAASGSLTPVVLGMPPPKHTVSSIATKDGVVDVYHLEDAFPGAGPPPGPTLSGSEFQDHHHHAFGRQHLLQQAAEQSLDRFGFDSRARADSMDLSSDDLLDEDEGPSAFSLAWQTVEDHHTGRQLRNSTHAFDAGFGGLSSSSSSSASSSSSSAGVGGGPEPGEGYRSAFASSLTSCMLVAVEDQEGNLISISEASDPNTGFSAAAAGLGIGVQDLTSDWTFMEGDQLAPGLTGGDWFVLGGGAGGGGVVGDAHGGMDLLQEDGSSSPSLSPGDVVPGAINFFSVEDPHLPDQPHFYHEIDGSGAPAPNTSSSSSGVTNPSMTVKHPGEHFLYDFPGETAYPITTAGDL